MSLYVVCVCGGGRCMREGQAGGEVSVADRGNGMCDCLSGGKVSPVCGDERRPA